MRRSRAVVAPGVLFVAFSLAGAAHAQGLDEALRACGRAFQSPSNRWHNFEDCGIRIVTARPIRPAVQTLPPGNGIGFGVHLEKLFNTARGDQHRTFVESVLAPNGSWHARGTLQLSFKPDTFSSGPNYVLAFTADALDAHAIDYYGLGPEALDVRTRYRYRALSVGANGRIPLGNAITVGGSLQAVAPRVKGAEESPPLDADWSEETAPGLNSEPTYLQSGVFVSAHDPDSQDNPDWTYTARYDWYHTKEPYAFGRLTIDLRHDLPVPKAGGYLLLHGRASVSHTGDDSVIPFFLQETVGGTNIRGESTVRGLDDYRYRGPHAALLQAEYRRPIWDPLGITLFYDAGTVATADGTMSGGDLQHSYGIGVTVSIPTTVVLRIYIARAGDNWHPFVGILDGF